MSIRPSSSTIAAVFALAVSLALCATSAGAAPYKWVDKDGKVHYSDQPPPGGVKAEKVELKPLTEVTIEPAPPSTSSAPTSAPAAADQVSYRSLTITNPQDQATIREASAGVSISVKLEPPLVGDDKLELTLDGNVVTENIPFIERGEHRIGARVIGADGSERIAAPTVTIYVHQTSSLPATPPKPKPKGKKPL